MHVCCAPCGIAPYRFLTDKGEYKVDTYWYNDNIHPYREYKKRFDTYQAWTAKEGIESIVEDDYNLELFLKKVADRSEQRCFICYYDRLKKTVLTAKKHSYDAFTSTLLYSVYQNHPLMKRIGEELALKYDVHFHYQDFRTLWQSGVELSRNEEMYRQPYCGCIYSEKERYHKKKINDAK